MSDSGIKTPSLVPGEEAGDKALQDVKELRSMLQRIPFEVGNFLFPTVKDMNGSSQSETTGKAVVDVAASVSPSKKS